VLYVSWEQATTAGDVSQSNYGNFEVYVSYSEDNGDTWMAPVDVTNTHTPSAPPGQCMSEAWPTLAEKVDSFLYIEYIQDRDAGGIPQTEGTWTENPVIYQKVPVSAIQTTLVVDLVATLPIVIPPGGGTFSYTANINNPGTNAVVFDVNTEAVLPNGNVYGPILLRNLLSLPAGGSLTRAMTQYVPAGAPAGSYTFRMRVGDYGWNVWVEDSFPFSKSAGWGPSPNVGNWNCYGWDNALEVTAPVPETPLLVTLSPNPFNPATEVTYTLGENSVIKLSVYDISGREVAILTNGYETAGVHKVTFNAGNLASGVYFFTLSNGSELVTVKSLLLK
jgi:hypothetical protein